MIKRKPHTPIFQSLRFSSSFVLPPPYPLYSLIIPLPNPLQASLFFSPPSLIVLGKKNLGKDSHIHLNLRISD